MVRDRERAEENNKAVHVKEQRKSDEFKHNTGCFNILPTQLIVTSIGTSK